MKSYKKITEKISKSLPTDLHKCNLIMTMMGISGVLLEYIFSNSDPKKLPLSVRYCASIAVSNINAFTSDQEIVPTVDFTAEEKEISEQTQERIYRQMKFIIKCLNESIKDDDII